MNDTTHLTAAAEAVRTARADVERIAGRLTDLRERSRDLDELQTALSIARDRRAAVLADALIAGTKPDTELTDKAVATAQRALLRREDEITAVSRAATILTQQHAEAEAKLSELTAAYHDARAGHVLNTARAGLAGAEAAVAALKAHVADALAMVSFLRLSTEMPPESRSWWSVQRKSLEAEVANLLHALPSLIGFDQSIGAGCKQLLADLKAADAGVNEVAEPAADQPTQCVWRDGTIHSEEEPAPADPVTAYTPGLRGAA